MSMFKVMTQEQTKELDELLSVADSILMTKSSVIKGNAKAATVVGTAIGGATGAAIMATASTAGVLGATVGAGSIAAGGVGVLGFSVLSVAAFPVSLAALLGLGAGLLFGKKRKKRKEEKRQATYVKEIVEKMQKILDKYNELKAEHERTDKEKDEIIRKQREKLAEYEAIFEALRKKRENLESNLACA